MNTKTTLSISEARKRIFDIAKKVQKPGLYYTLTEKGEPRVVLMSAEDFESRQETLDILQTFPNLPKEIAEVDKDIRTGKYKSYITLEELLAKEGFVLNKHSSKKYEISSPAGKKR